MAGPASDPASSPGYRPHPSAELEHNRGEDGVELSEDASTGGGGDHAVLGHHADRTPQPERLAPVTALRPAALLRDDGVDPYSEAIQGDGGLVRAERDAERTADVD